MGDAVDRCEGTMVTGTASPRQVTGRRGTVGYTWASAGAAVRVVARTVLINHLHADQLKGWVTRRVSGDSRGGEGGFGGDAADYARPRQRRARGREARAREPEERATEQDRECHHVGVDEMVRGKGRVRCSLHTWRPVASTWHGMAGGPTRNGRAGHRARA